VEEKMDKAIKFWKAMLENETPEISIGSIDIYEINDLYILFNGYSPIQEEVESAYGVVKNTNKTLQDAVDMALAIEFGS
jgi:hypothetical protein